MKTKKIFAFNLQEMLIVLAILGILLLIALPNKIPNGSENGSANYQYQVVEASVNTFKVRATAVVDLTEMAFLMSGK